MGKKNKLEIHKFYWFLILLTFFIFIIGILSVIHSSKIYEYPPFETYSFTITSLAEKGVVNFTTFRMNYHFGRKTGTFSFIPEKDIDRMILNFPKEFEIYSIKKWGNNSKVNFPVKEINLTEKNAKIWFEGKSKEEWIFIDFKIDLSPNARFKIFKNSIWRNNDHFYFNMDGEFECTREDCFFNLVNSEINREHLGTQQEGSSAIKFVNQTIGFESPNEHEFELSGRSRNALTLKNIWMTIGISLIVGTIFSLISILIAVFQDNKPKRKS